MLDSYPDGCAVIIGYDKSGKPCGYAEKSLRGTLTDEPIKDALYNVISSSAVSYFTARKLYEGDSISAELDFARRMYEICRSMGKAYLDHAVFVGGEWVRLVSEFKRKITGKIKNG